MNNRLEQIKAQLAEMELDFQKWEEKGNKSAGKRLRLACSAMAKAFKELRRELLEASKQ